MIHIQAELDRTDIPSPGLLQSIVPGTLELAETAHEAEWLTSVSSCFSVVWKRLRVKPLLCGAGNGSKSSSGNNNKINVMISTYLER